MAEMRRTIEQWRNGDPEAMACHMSEAAIMFALKDAKADILALHAENERLIEALKIGEEAIACLAADMTGTVGLDLLDTIAEPLRRAADARATMKAALLSPNASLRGAEPVLSAERPSRSES